MELAKGKLADIVQHFIYEIATGKWTPLQKLPSIREAEAIWGVNRLTVLAAYRELEKIGLVKSKDRSGYYVIENDENNVFDTNLNQLYGKLKAFIGKQTDLDLTYVLRYFNAMAISESKINPTYAFLECTMQQAEDHSREIFEKLNIFVQPVCIQEYNVLESKIPDSAQILMTTGFHIREVRGLGKKFKKKVVNIPIEIDPDFFTKAQHPIGKVVMVEFENNMSSKISGDIRNIIENVKLEEKLIRNTEDDLLQLINDPTNQLILLSPRVWGQASETIKKDKRVKLIRFRISDASWKVISQTIGIPFQGAKNSTINFS